MGCWEAIVPREGGIPRVGLWKIRPSECPGEPGCAHLSLQHSRALGGGHGLAWAGSAPERRGTAGKSLYSSSSILLLRAELHRSLPWGEHPLGLTSVCRGTESSPGLTSLCRRGSQQPPSLQEVQEETAFFSFGCSGQLAGKGNFCTGGTGKKAESILIPYNYIIGILIYLYIRCLIAIYWGYNIGVT